MTRVLSLTACCRLAERAVRGAGGDLARDDLLAQLAALDVDEERAAVGVRLAITVGRLAAIPDADGANHLIAEARASER